MASLPHSGRADLLRLLAATHGTRASEVPYEELRRLAERLELHPQPGEVVAVHVDAVPDEESEPPDEPKPAFTPAPEPARRPPLQARFFVVLQASTPPAPAPRPTPVHQPLTAADCEPRRLGEAPILPLVPRTRLWPALRRSLARPGAGGLDVPALVRRLARAENIRRLPRRSRPGSGGEVWVVLDRAQRLLPYDTDFDQIIGEVTRLYGAASLHLWVVCESPDAVLWTRRGRGVEEGVRGRIPVPPPGTPVLILGDLGLLSPSRGQEAAWVGFCRRLRDGGADPVAWLPLSPRLVSRQAALHARVHCLGGDLHPLRPARCAEAPPLPAVALDSLLTRLACCVRVEPALLRSLRLMHPDTAAEPGLEALVWGHPSAVTAGYRFCEIARARQANYRARFAALDAAAQDEILRRMLATHAHRGRATETVEALIWRAHTGRDAPPGEPAERMGEAAAWLPRAAASAGAGLGDVAEYARDLLYRQGGDTALCRDNSPALARLWLMTGQESIPQGLRSEDIDAAWIAQPRPFYYHLAQRDGRLFIEQAPDRGPPDRALQFGSKYLDARTGEWREAPQGRLAGSEVHIAGRFEWFREDGTVRDWLEAPGDDGVRELRLGDAPAGAVFTLRAGDQILQLGLLPRPSWAREWGFDAEGLYAQAPSPLGGEVRLHATPWVSEAWQGSWPPGPRAFQALPKLIGQEGMRLGADLQYGLYLDVPFGNATQRFRWIEPGEFLMGSPEGEPERDGDEGPQHVVRLTEGYWLAETACSQAVWETVMGNNPSRFKDDPQNPVENVSWDDVAGEGGFLRRLEKLLPGVEASLPTEAEWEYACRAGTKDAFNWGSATLLLEQANYDASTAYNGGLTGEYRQKTVPVKSFTPNAWGLYQMHGNVWEWCADGARAYDGTPQVNPRGETGDEEDSSRVFRGGSWFSAPDFLRAACRIPWSRDWRDDDEGFRFLLRSASPGAEHPPVALAAPKVDGVSKGLLSRDPRSSYVDYVLNVITGSEDSKGPVQWSELRTKIPVAKRPKSKRKGRK
ncbi:formylglycine-generating enzyme family protein [Zoogloea ramigera]|uniref:formylglycine-generating enzyme family protein n=1 Tax=Zoogloea ramigera TaxID=350 RepID=UPI003FA32329